MRDVEEDLIPNRGEPSPLFGMKGYLFEGYCGIGAKRKSGAVLLPYLLAGSA
jgi:hypothetical protein